MSPDLSMSRRAALKLTAWAGAGLVAGACTGRDHPTVAPEQAPLPGTTAAEQAPLPGRPANVRVSQDEFVAHAEPCLAVNPRDPRNLLGACIAHDEGGGTQIAAYASFDGGASWRSLGGLEDSAGGRDPTVTFDAAGRGYVCANTDDLHVWRTDDGGRTFAAPVLATRGHKLDHPWLAADPAPGPSSATHLYGAWTGPDNRQLEVGRSTDRGESWGRPVELGTGAMEIRVRPDTNGLGLPSIVASSSRDLAAAAFVVHQPGASFADIAVCLSRDRGRSWTAPKTVPRAGPDTFYLQPQLAMDEAGRLALSAFAYRRGLVDVVVLVAEPATVRFGRPVRVTSRPFDPARGTLSGKHGAWWIGDYQGLASAAGRVHPFWNDPRTGRLELFTASLREGLP